MKQLLFEDIHPDFFGYGITIGISSDIYYWKLIYTPEPEEQNLLLDLQT